MPRDLADVLHYFMPDLESAQDHPIPAPGAKQVERKAAPIQRTAAQLDRPVAFHEAAALREAAAQHKSASHQKAAALPLAAVPVGTLIVGETTPVHRGRTTMVWQTRINADSGRLAALVTQTQLVLAPRA